MKKNMNRVSEAASILGKYTVNVRRAEWGEKEFVRRMQEWGKLGGRHCYGSWLAQSGTIDTVRIEAAGL